MTVKEAIFVVNAGSSSLKFQCFEVVSGMIERLFRGQIDGIGVRPEMRITDADGHEMVARSFDASDMPDLPTAIDHMSEWMQGRADFKIIAVGHRVVHGGPDYAAPVRIDADVLAQLAGYQELAPLHQPNNLAPIRKAMALAPDVPQIACFDTAFHRTHARQADCYALPKALYEEGVRRYGFHGLSYEYIALKLPEAAPDIASGRVIAAHLGSGASLCALDNRVSVHSTMGLTALDGIPMGTRPGQLDPGVVLYLMSHKGMSADEVTDLVYHRAGLLGLSGVSADMRELLASESADAAFAVEHFVHRCGLHIGMLAAALQGVDGIVFTAGVGENAPLIRARIVQQMAWLGAELDPAANTDGQTCISTPQSKLGLYVVPTDEEWIIARETLGVISG